ncbi:restriction endonuclease subunit S [Rosistilla oblonga]|uniref:restriction endonuclease subunit S n=1 Tax=Rosistilla oblonga TaxID=2527990 RepID=UPI003A96CE08
MSHEAIPNGWCRARLDDVCQLDVGFAFKSKEFAKDGIRLLRGDNIEPGALRWKNARFWPQSKLGEHQGLLLNEGDIILAMDRPIISSGLKLARVRPDDLPCLLVQRVARLKSSEPTLTSFVYCILQSQEFLAHLFRGQTGTQLPHISGAGIGSFCLPIPPLAEQSRINERIDELLSELDAGVAALKRVQANLRRYRASVLKAAVEGKLTEEWRAKHSPKETGEELLKRTLEERRQEWESDQLADYEAKGKEPPKNWQARYKEPDALDTSELPELPDSWCWARISQVGHVQLGRQRSPKHHTGTHMRPYLRVANVFEDRIDISDVMEMNFTPAEFENYALRYGDILLNEGQSHELVGRPAMYRDEVPGCCFTNTLVRFRVADGLDRDFALRVFLAYLKNGRFQKIASITVNIAHLGAGRFAELEFPLPPEEEQAEIVRIVDELYTQIDAAELAVKHGMKRAARLRQSILKDAFEGKLVAQDPADEPASELLARIKAERRAAVPKAKKKSTQRTPRVPKKVTQRRGAIVAYTIAQTNGKATRKSEALGRTKLVKALYIAQTHEELDLQFRFQRYAAGPFDEALYKLEGTGNKNDWFTTKERDNFGVTYHPADNTDAMCEEATEFLGDRKDSIDRLLNHIAKMDMKQAELFATTYAAWNDLLIDGRKVTEASIIEDFYDWDESKKKFKKPEIKKQLKWMRSEGYVPTGKGERTETRTKDTKLPSKKRRRSNA